MSDRALLLGVLLMGLIGGALFGLLVGDRTTYVRGYAAAVDSVKARGVRVVSVEDTLLLAWDRDSLPVLLWVPKRVLR